MSVTMQYRNEGHPEATLTLEFIDTLSHMISWARVSY